MMTVAPPLVLLMVQAASTRGRIASARRGPTLSTFRWSQALRTCSRRRRRRGRWGGRGWRRRRRRSGCGGGRRGCRGGLLGVEAVSLVVQRLGGRPGQAAAGGGREGTPMDY